MIEYPDMRASAIYMLRSLADPEHQQRIWIEGDLPNWRYWDALDMIVRDSEMNGLDEEDLSGQVGLTFENAEEAAAVQKVYELLWPLVDKLGDADDAVYVADPVWPEIVAAAQAALAALGIDDHRVRYRQPDRRLMHRAGARSLREMMDSIKVPGVRYGSARAELVENIRAFADTAYQRRVWVDRDMPYADYDDSAGRTAKAIVRIVEQRSKAPKKLIGEILRSEEEEDALRRLIARLEEAGAGRDEVPDSELIARPAWRGVVDAAHATLDSFGVDDHAMQIANPPS